MRDVHLNGEIFSDLGGSMDFERVLATVLQHLHQIASQVGMVRERFFTPRLRFASYEGLNAWLLDRCLEHARVHRHPELHDRTIVDVFEDEKPALMRMPDDAAQLLA